LFTPARFLSGANAIAASFAVTKSVAYAAA
jgi:hypothetical protein